MSSRILRAPILLHSLCIYPNGQWPMNGKQDWIPGPAQLTYLLSEFKTFCLSLFCIIVAVHISRYSLSMQCALLKNHLCVQIVTERNTYFFPPVFLLEAISTKFIVKAHILFHIFFSLLAFTARTFLSRHLRIAEYIWIFIEWGWFLLAGSEYESVVCAELLRQVANVWPFTCYATWINAV